MDGSDRPARLSALLAGTAAEHLPSSSHEQSTVDGIDNSSNARPGHGLPTSGDLIRSRVSDPQRSRFSAISRPSPLSRDYQTSSSPAPIDNDAHIPARERQEDVAQGFNPFRLTQVEGTRMKAGNNAQLKSRKSLHQRLDGGVNKKEADVSDHMHEGRQDDAGRRVSYPVESHGISRTRSASVVSSAYGQAAHDEDISSIMMRGATDLRNVKFENEEQRREITFLQSQLQSAVAEKEDVLRRLSAVKASAKQGLESTSKRMRNTVQTHSRPLFNDEAIFKDDRNKILMSELQIECSKSGQVADLLRERLQSLDVESAQAADREALRAANASSSSAMEHIRELVDQLAIRRSEVQDALIAGGELEMKLKTAEEQIDELKAKIDSQQTELTNKVALERENSKLAALLCERDARLTDLELEAAISLSNEHSGRIRVLEAHIASRMSHTELNDRNSNLKQELVFKKELAQVMDEKQLLKQELLSANSSLEETKRELETVLMRDIHHANTKCQVLEDQTIGTLQDRLTESEANMQCRELESTAGKYTCQIAVLSEQKSAAVQQSGTAVKAEYEDKLVKQAEMHHLNWTNRRKRIKCTCDDAHNALENARSTVKSLEEEVSTSRQELLEAIDSLNAEIMALREEKTELVLRARSIDSRYRTGDLNEEEKVFINTLIRTSQSIHEQELVRKEMN
ncbi:hypothetical protein BC629DRAFT_1528565 [Irpex lacteus]|nr:hypothetical protein BC629DRAFT_1528565 [Irpex lacteus]